MNSSPPHRRRIDRRLSNESGQSSVEFALVFPLLLLIFVGIVQFGILFNHWLDETHLANSGARYAAVANVPGGASLDTFLKNQAGTTALKNGMSVSLKSPDGKVTGNRVYVEVSSTYHWLPILSFLGDKTVTATATMRLEAKSTAALNAIGAC